MATAYEELEMTIDVLEPRMHELCPKSATCKKDGVVMPNPSTNNLFYEVGKGNWELVVAYCPRKFGITENGVFAISKDNPYGN